MAISHDAIKRYYSNVTLNEEGVMTTHTCACGPEAMPAYIREIEADIPEEITSRFYGCGSPLPPALEGCTVLDLGCGTGRDVYLASKLVGPEGHVIGVDMNSDQIWVAEEHHAEMAEKWGYDNVEFKVAYIEDLADLGIKDKSVDVVISNCVINLSPDKEAVFSEVYRVLKVGGELYFSDIFADRRVPSEINGNLMLVGECLGGAMFTEDFRRVMQKCGWPSFRYMEVTPATIDNPEVEGMIGNIKFTSRTVRAVKHPHIEDTEDQYGQFAVYNGGIEGSANWFDLDLGHRFYVHLPKAVSGNTACMLQGTRFAKYFKVYGNRSRHFGLFKEDSAGAMGVGTAVLTGGSNDTPGADEYADGGCCCGEAGCC